MESLYLSLPCGIALHGSAATYLSLLSCRTLELFLAFHAHREGALIIELCVFWETQVLVFLRCSWGDPLGPRGGRVRATGTGSDRHRSGWWCECPVLPSAMHRRCSVPAAASELRGAGPAGGPDARPLKTVT